MSSERNSTSIDAQLSFSSQLQNYKRCIKCGEDFRNYKRHFSECRHNLNVCYQCYIQHLEKRIQNNEILTCPLCPANMLLDSDQFSTFFNHLPVSRKLIIEQYVKRDPSQFTTWICSVNGCGGKIPNEICQKCGKHYCAKCKQFQHPLQGCPINIHTSTTSSIENSNKISCPLCDFINNISARDRLKKSKPCQNKYCKAFICVQHRTRWNKHHDNFHPADERIFENMATCNEGCKIY